VKKVVRKAQALAASAVASPSADVLTLQPDVGDSSAFPEFGAAQRADDLDAPLGASVRIDERVVSSDVQSDAQRIGACGAARQPDGCGICRGQFATSGKKIKGRRN
jgi:hypothetical protein